MKVIFVHGRAQEHKEPAGLLVAWSNAANKALTALKVATLPAADVALPYYGDLLFNLTDKVSRESFQSLMDKGAEATSPPAEEQQFIQELVFQMAASQGISKEQIAIEAAVNVEVVEKGIQNWKIVLAAVRLLNKINGVGATSIELFTRDVWYYLTNKGLRLKINAVVDAAIPKDQSCMIVSHSLGTIVAYNLLMNRGSRQNVKAFITIGSPLGIEAIYRRLPSDTKPRRSPSDIPVWFNARDPQDIVALYEIPAEFYAGAPIVNNFSAVKNTSENHHGIVEYLADPTLAKAISDVFSPA